MERTRSTRSIAVWHLASLLGAIPALIAGSGPSSVLAQPVPLQYGPAACTVPDSIHGSLERIARRVGGHVGVSAIHLESGTRISLNGERAFPMASVSKIPMALEFLHRVDEGEIRLTELVVVPPTDFRPGNSPLARWYGRRAARLTVDSLFSLMLGVSDNTATDVILRMSGGPDAATRRVRALGVEGVRVDRSEARTFGDLVGIPDTVPETELFRSNYYRLRQALPLEHREAARERYGYDPRDTATPNGMAQLLAHMHDGAGLAPSSQARLLEVMTKTRTGRKRLKGLLPSGTEVAHKTGTMAAAINDVGIVTLPEGAGHLAVAVFVNTLRATKWRRERTIAQMSKVLHDYFTVTYGVRGLGPLASECMNEPPGLPRLGRAPTDEPPSAQGTFSAGI